MTEKAAWLLQVGGDLGEEFAIGKPDRDGDANLRFDAPGEFGERARRRVVMQPLGAAKFQKCLVDRQRLHQRRQILHQRPYLAPDPDIFLHIRTDDDGLWACLQRLEHRHRRAHSVDAGNVACSGDDAAFAAADDHGLVGKLGIVALLDGRIEGVAIDMRQRQCMELAMAH